MIIYTLQDVFVTVSGEVRGFDEVFLCKTDEINEGRIETAEKSNRWLHSSMIDNPHFYARYLNECSMKSILII